MYSMSVALDTSHLERSALNDDAYWNILSMLVTLDTSHSEMSPLHDDANANNVFMSVTAETSQDPIGPCGPLEQSAGDSSRHSVMAALSSALDFGAHPVVGHHTGHMVSLQ